MWPKDVVVQAWDLLPSTIYLFQDLKPDHILMSVAMAPASKTELLHQRQDQTVELYGFSVPAKV